MLHASWNAPYLFFFFAILGFFLINLTQKILNWHPLWASFNLKSSYFPIQSHIRYAYYPPSIENFWFQVNLSWNWVGRAVWWWWPPWPNLAPRLTQNYPLCQTYIPGLIKTSNNFEVWLGAGFQYPVSVNPIRWRICITWSVMTTSDYSDGLLQLCTQKSFNLGKLVDCSSTQVIDEEIWDVV